MSRSAADFFATVSPPAPHDRAAGAVRRAHRPLAFRDLQRPSSSLAEPKTRWIPRPPCVVRGFGSPRVRRRRSPTNERMLKASRLSVRPAFRSKPPRSESELVPGFHGSRRDRRQRVAERCKAPIKVWLSVVLLGTRFPNKSLGIRRGLERIPAAEGTQQWLKLAQAVAVGTALRPSTRAASSTDPSGRC